MLPVEQGPPGAVSNQTIRVQANVVLEPSDGVLGVNTEDAILVQGKGELVEEVLQRHDGLVVVTHHEAGSELSPGLWVSHTGGREVGDSLELLEGVFSDRVKQTIC